MLKYSNFIRSVEVKYYRSINTTKIKNCHPFNVVTGPNDVGKSNLLRALNLFFNEMSPTGEDIEFSEEFSHKRLEAVRKDSVKGRQFIQITVEFNRSSFFPNTLPPRFTVTKTWYRDSDRPTVSDNLQSYISNGSLDTTIVKAKSSLQKFLNRFVFTYIPAIKDRDIFLEIFAELQESMFASSEAVGSPLTTQIEAFNQELQTLSKGLLTDFTASTNINADISLPLSLSELFQSFNIRTDGHGGEYVSLDRRGDGIRVRFIPAMMNYIAEHSQSQHIWGFEEPENSMEFRRAFELSQKLRSVYSQNAQIFITTHSPAFVDFSDKNQSIYLAKQTDSSTSFFEVNEKTSPALFGADADIGLAEELGHIRLLDKLHGQLSDALVQAEAVKAATAMVEKELEESKRPLLLTEGKTDPAIVCEAWRRLVGGEPPFSVKSCNVLPDGDANEAAGATVLAGALKTIRADSPQLTVGLFDRDDEGIKAFNLDKNFDLNPKTPFVKAHKNGKSIAVLMPYPDCKSHFGVAENLPIEMLFDEDFLKTRVGEYGLDLFYPMEIRIVMGKTVSSVASTEPAFLRIRDGKKYFSKTIVPTLPDEAFTHFQPLIDALQIAIASS